MPEDATPHSDMRLPPSPTVVIVDDDEALLQALKFALEIEGYRILACRTGEEFMQADVPDEAACLIVDYKLDGVDGLHALEQLRARGVRAPAVLITSYANPLLRDRARRAGAHIIEKPLLGDALLAHIRNLLPLP